MTNRRIIKELKEAIQAGRIESYIEEAVNKRKGADAEFVRIARLAVTQLRKEPVATRRKLFPMIFKGMKNDEYSESMIKAATGIGMPLEETSSFRALLTQRTRVAQLGPYAMEWKLNNKLKAFWFVDLVGVRRPKSIKEDCRFSDIQRMDRVVIKPAAAAGSSGVYLVKTSSEIIDVKNKGRLNSWEELSEVVRQYLEKGATRRDRWIVQEAFFDPVFSDAPARDMRVYCFYGKAQLIQETVNRHADRKDCWWNAKGNITKAGPHEDRFFEGVGLSPDELKIVEHLGSRIPVPFLRIDFLKSSQGLVFSEFTPRPGNYEKFRPKIDKTLGEAFLEAEGRLLRDLIAGKQFEEISAFMREFSLQE